MKTRTTFVLSLALGLSALFLSGCMSDPYTSMRTGPYDPNGRIYPGAGAVGGSVYVDPYGRPVQPGYGNGSYGNGSYGAYGSYGYGSPYPYGGYYGGSPYPYGGYYGGYGYGSPYGYPQVVVTPSPRPRYRDNAPQPPRIERPQLPPRQPGEPPRTFRELFPKAHNDDRRPENIP